MSLLSEVLADLAAEGSAVEELVADLPEPAWRTATPAEGWDVATTVAHLLWTDEVSLDAIDASLGEASAWEALMAKAYADPEGCATTEARRIADTHDGGALLERWRTSRPALAARLLTVPADQRLVWFGPPMSAASMATARLMETWAHGLDIADALGVELQPTDRLRHIANLAFRTRAFAYLVHGLEAPDSDVRVALEAPSGTAWTFGPDDAEQQITGTAYDFCRLATRRIHRDDTGLVAMGTDADTWLSIIQAYAGPPGSGRQGRYQA